MDEQSRNSWINKDEPVDASNMARHKDGFEDILEERRHNSDFKYCIRKRPDIPSYKYCKQRTPEEIKEHVMNSDRVKYRIEMICSETGVSLDEVRQEAKSILDEMAHKLNMTAIRHFAYVLVKVFKALFRRVYVNEEGVQMLHKLIHEYPVLIIPSHRSYLDFLLVSYIFYEYDLPLPVIAAAMDFKGMKFFGWLLRNSGAFYIRRSFGTDQLYWAVFTEYVQTQLRNGDAPVEFFIEGTRSRTAKSYKPRIGMLSAALESYFKAEVPDIMIVPISVSYDRIVEESLYAYELLGVPKPKESASGVFKARKILSEDFGSIHLHIGQPESIRQFSVGKIDRVRHGLEPRYINNLTAEETVLMKDLAHHMVLRQQQHLVISPWSLMATVLLQNREGIPVKDLMKEVDWLKRQCYNLGAYVDWPGNASTESVIWHYVGLHRNIVNVRDNDVIELVIEKPQKSQPAQDMLIANAANHLMLASYRNQLLHVFVRVAMVALSVNGCCKDEITIDELFERYSFLEKLFNYDFIFMPGNTRKDFDQAVRVLANSGGLVLSDNTIMIKKSINKHTTFLSLMFEPFLISYWVLCQYLLSVHGDVNGRTLAKPAKELVKNAQKLAKQLVKKGVTKHCEIMSLDILNNGLSALASMGAVFKDKREENPYMSPNQIAVSRIVEQIGMFIELPAETMTQILASRKTIVVSAKL